ncbi:hypothetical protein HELRODRAFT_177352 [Helobdella robusta]|uniref:Apple domain-containing protein n=1 Tax=Helobdella robusta TaxID=6412 RepID=T1FBJ8_HELRO|nr:hypothetical protein HELRODRAFT_177352 [Helobdella robusta]ESN98114.1 hypothetical protein HELRODRAFT_177352 [Helobdella robusta]
MVSNISGLTSSCSETYQAAVPIEIRTKEFRDFVDEFVDENYEDARFLLYARYSRKMKKYTWYSGVELEVFDAVSNEKECKDVLYLARNRTIQAVECSADAQYSVLCMADCLNIWTSHKTEKSPSSIEMPEIVTEQNCKEVCLKNLSLYCVAVEWKLYYASSFKCYYDTVGNQVREVASRGGSFQRVSLKKSVSNDAEINNKTFDKQNPRSDINVSHDLWETPSNDKNLKDALNTLEISTATHRIVTIVTTIATITIIIITIVTETIII